MPAFREKYTDDQRRAMAEAFELKRIRPDRRVVELARQGLLELDGKPLPAFEANVNSVRHYARKLRARQLPAPPESTLADAPPRDALEALRRRLVTAADRELARIERAQELRPDEPLDAEQGRQVARMVAEAARIPAPTAEPLRPGDTGYAKTAVRPGNGLAGRLMAEHLRTTSTSLAPQPIAPPPPPEAEPEPVDDSNPAATFARQEIERVRAAQEEAARERAAAARADDVEPEAPRRKRGRMRGAGW